MIDKVKEKTECVIDEILEEGINTENVDMLYKVIDIHKDVENEEYWKIKEECMMYRGGYGNYGTYNEYGARGRNGRYSTGNNYGRRYQGHDVIDDMSESYGAYMESKETGRYGSPESCKALEYMLESVVTFVEMLNRDAQSQEEVDMIRHYTKKISEI